MCQRNQKKSETTSTHIFISIWSMVTGGLAQNDTDAFNFITLPAPHSDVMHIPEFGFQLISDSNIGPALEVWTM